MCNRVNGYCLFYRPVDSFIFFIYSKIIVLFLCHSIKVTLFTTQVFLIYKKFSKTFKSEKIYLSKNFQSQKSKQKKQQYL